MSKSNELGTELMFNAFEILKENNCELEGYTLMQKVGERTNLDEWAKKVFPNGNIRWQNIFHFFSIGPVKAGFINKRKGVWYLTKAGEEAIKLGKDKLRDECKKKYDEWYEKNKTNAKEDTNIDEEIEKENDNSDILLEDAENKSRLSISNAIKKLDEYEFQELVGALLRGMGYYTPFVAPRGKDGGIDIIAYKDPIGVTGPHIKVQVKHFVNNNITVQQVRELKGVIQKDDIGLFVCSSDFTSEAQKEFRSSNNPHIELINLNKLIELWIQFFPNMNEEDKNRLPIIPIYFLDKKK